MLSTRLKNKIQEINEMANQVEQFDTDFDSTVISTLWDLNITYNDKFVWIKAKGFDDLKERITLSNCDAIEDLRFYLRHLRKGLKQALKYK